MALRLYLMRHGETEWSLSGQHTGRVDIPLTVHGEHEARQLGQRLRAINFDQVWVSPLQRARQTCERADRLIERLKQLDGNIALFSHSHFGRVLGVRWIGLPVQTGQHFILHTASLSVLCYQHERVDEPAIEAWNS